MYQLAEELVYAHGWAGCRMTDQKFTCYQQAFGILDEVNFYVEASTLKPFRVEVPTLAVGRTKVQLEAPAAGAGAEIVEDENHASPTSSTAVISSTKLNSESLLHLPDAVLHLKIDDQNHEQRAETAVVKSVQIPFEKKVPRFGSRSSTTPSRAEEAVADRTTSTTSNSNSTSPSKQQSAQQARHLELLNSKGRLLYVGCDYLNIPPQHNGSILPRSFEMSHDIYFPESFY
ncbi:unnamed protein product, partial [Amoebophrya sp. A25]|eukprot:GSA25T00002383001.1